MLRVTPLVRNLIIINIVVFLAQQLLQSLYLTQYLSLWPLGTEYFRPYQFFTYMLAHGGYGHIFFNMLALASFAPILETYWGDKRFLAFYIAAGIGAGVFYAGLNLLMGTSGGLMLGASGAIYGILAAFGILFPNMEISLLFPPIPIKAKYMVFVMGGLTWAMDPSGPVAHLAHFGGAVMGALIILYWRSQGGGGNKGW